MTIAPEETRTLLFALFTVNAMSAFIWALLAGAARLRPAASWAMAVANAAAALSVGLHCLRGVLPDPLTYWPGDVLAVLTFASLSAAVPAVATRRLSWPLPLAVLLGAALLMALLPYDGDLRWQARVISATAALLSLRAALDARAHLAQARVQLSTSRWLSVPMLLIALLMGLRGLETLVFPGRTPDMRVPTPFNLVFLWGALMLSLVQNATLAFLVLMQLILRIRQLTERDPLTGALNRRAFEAALVAAHLAASRGQAYALVMIDMDHFKQVNDGLGHAAGDAALHCLVQTLQPCLREIDSLGRIGGEEFAVLLPDTGLAGAALVAERMRQLLASAEFTWQGRPWPLTASFGIAESLPGDPSGEAVLARADAGLYRAKAQGRNLVQPHGA